MTQNLDALIGPSDKGSEYAVEDTMTFLEDKQQYTGKVIHCAAPSTSPSGKQLPRLYTVDCNDGFPHMVTQAQIVQEKEA